MKLSTKTIDAINSLVGTSPESYQVFIDGMWLETDCISWQAPNLKISENLEGAPSQNEMRKRWGIDSLDMSQYPPEIQKLLEKTQAAMEAKVVTEYEKFLTRTTKQPSSFDSLLNQVKMIIRDEPALAYLNETNWIIIAPTLNQFEILEIERTNGNNYELDTQTLIKNLIKLDKKFGIDIIKATSTSVEFLFQNVPNEQEAEEIRNWLVEICPDLHEIPQDFHEQKISLWWD